MNVVISGGTGLIGNTIVRRLGEQGNAVTILSRNRKESSLPGVTIVTWDAKTLDSWTEFVERADAVINVAGESVGAGRWTDKRKANIIGSRVQATNALVDAIGRCSKKPTVLVNASAVGYYGNVEEEAVTESTPAGNDFLAQTCAQWEAAARRVEQFGVRVVMLRTGFVLAADAEAFRKMQLPFKLFVGGPFGSGRQWFPWIHLHDVVSGYIFAVESQSLSGPVNLASPNPVRINELARALGRAMHRPAFLPAPAFALKLILGEMSDLLLKGQKVVPRKLLDNGFDFRFPSLPEALNDLVD